MIGALSIVRFRHPVKSALELIIYFDLITIGIATSVRTKWAIQLVIVTVLIIFFVKIIQKISNRFGKSFYNITFNEGHQSNTLEIHSSEKIEEVENSKNLQNYFNDKSVNEIVYRMNFENRNQLQEFKVKIEKQTKINKINVILN